MFTIEQYICSQILDARPDFAVLVRRRRWGKYMEVFDKHLPFICHLFYDLYHDQYITIKATSMLLHKLFNKKLPC